MPENSKLKTIKVFKYGLYGMSAFFLSGLIAVIIILFFDEYIVSALVAGWLGGFLTGTFLRMKDKRAKMAASGAIGMPLGLFLSFGAAGLFELMFPFASASLAYTGIPDAIGISIMGLIFGSIMGIFIFGSSALKIFAPVCTLASMPFGILVSAMNEGYVLRDFNLMMNSIIKGKGIIDLNSLVITVSLGIGTGLSIAIHDIISRKKHS